MKFNDEVENEISSIIKNNHENKYLYGTSRNIYERCIIKTAVNIQNSINMHKDIGHVNLINRNPYLSIGERMMHCINDYSYIGNFLKSTLGDYKNTEESKLKFSQDMMKLMNIYYTNNFRRENIELLKDKDIGSLTWTKKNVRD